MEKVLLSACRPVVDLKKKPQEEDAPAGSVLLESQLLINELFRPLDEYKDWYYGEAPEQPYYVQGTGWTGYPGWVRKTDLVRVAGNGPTNAVVASRDAVLLRSVKGRKLPAPALPFGSRVRAAEDDREGSRCRVWLRSGLGGWVDREALRFHHREKSLPPGQIGREIAGNALLCLNVPYLWGGRSAALPGGAEGVACGIDCSSLVCLSCRLAGIDVPRNARDQWIFAEPVTDGLEAGDLVFIEPAEGTGEIRHVMIHEGREALIEASRTGKTVAMTSFGEKFGASRDRIQDKGMTADGRKIHFGRITGGLTLLPPS